VAVLLLADWGFERDRLLCHPHDLPHLVSGHIQFGSDLLSGRLVPVFVQEL
jgi:hypothetical protein